MSVRPARWDDAPHADAAVIEEARRRQRRHRRILAAALLAAALLAGVGAWLARDGGGDGAPQATSGQRATVETTTRCLESRGALVTRAPAVLDFPRGPAIHVSFALVPGQRPDGLTISFQRDRATAAAAAERVVRRFESREPSIGRLLVVEKNAIVVWDTLQHTSASRADVLACL